MDKAFHTSAFHYIKGAVLLILFVRKSEEARRAPVGASSAGDVGADQDVKYVAVSRYLI